MAGKKALSEQFNSSWMTNDFILDNFLLDT